MNATTGKYLIGAGVVLLVAGILVYFFSDKLTWLGRLPGDIRFESKNGGGFYFPIVTCLVISLLLNLIIFLIRKFLG